MKTSFRFTSRRTAGKSLALAAFLVVANIIIATPAMADRQRTTTVIRETVYHSPSRVIVQPSVIIPISNSVYVGLGSSAYADDRHRHTTVYREVSRYDTHYDNHRNTYYDRGFRHPGRGNAFGHRKQEPARGRWSGANNHREVIYVDRDGRRSSSYREAERRSVVIRERSR
jgi:hypothetical protein